MSDCGCHIEIQDKTQRHVLYWLLGINTAMFVFEIGLGWYAESTALIADALDMLADAVVYGIGLYAVGRALADKARAARLSGYFQFGLACLILIDIARRTLFGSEPVSLFMISVGSLALLANLTCLALIYKHREGEVHMRASWIFSANDVLANLGVILGGLLVMWLDNRWPDLMIGVLILLLILRGARMILADARNELACATADNGSCHPTIPEREL